MSAVGQLKILNKRYRNAIDAMEIALMGAPQLIDLPCKWGEPRYRGKVQVTVTLTVDQVYRICDACAELTHIINADDDTLVSEAVP